MITSKPTRRNELTRAIYSGLREIDYVSIGRIYGTSVSDRRATYMFNRPRKGTGIVLLEQRRLRQVRYFRPSSRSGTTIQKAHGEGERRFLRTSILGSWHLLQGYGCYRVVGGWAKGGSWLRGLMSQCHMRIHPL